MKELEKQFMSGDGGFSTNPRRYRQIKRTESVALYFRFADNHITDYEVFYIGKDEENEKYPSTCEFGRSAWSALTLDHALNLYDKLLSAAPGEIINFDEGEVTEVIQNKRAHREKKTESVYVLPTGEFTTGELAELNKVQYIYAFNFLKTEIESGRVKFLREERRNTKGKPSKIFTKM